MIGRVTRQWQLNSLLAIVEIEVEDEEKKKKKMWCRGARKRKTEEGTREGRAAESRRVDETWGTLVKKGLPLHLLFVKTP